MALNSEQMHRLGQAVAIVFATVKASGRELQAVSRIEGVSEAHAVGEVTTIALARAGFVVTYDPQKAAAIAGEYGMGPVDMPRQTM